MAKDRSNRLKNRDAWQAMRGKFVLCCGMAALCSTPGLVQAQSLGSATGQPLLIEVTPLQDAVPANVPPPLRHVELNLQPVPEFGAADFVQDGVGWEQADDGETFRRQHQKKTIKLLLYGVVDTAQAEVQDTDMPKVSRNMKRFMDGHFASIKKDYFNQGKPDAARLLAGDPSFISTAMTRGMAQKPAKLAGVTIPIGDVTIGGGYTWAETNPALMQSVKKGMIVGASYQIGNVPLQVSYMTSGREMAGVSTGGKYEYDNLMIGANIPIHGWAVNTTLQYRDDRSRADGDQQQIMVTIGTKIRF